jgi:hypothetical protein
MRCLWDGKLFLWLFRCLGIFVGTVTFRFDCVPSTASERKVETFILSACQGVECELGGGLRSLQDVVYVDHTLFLQDHLHPVEELAAAGKARFDEG